MRAFFWRNRNKGHKLWISQKFCIDLMIKFLTVVLYLFGKYPENCLEISSWEGCKFHILEWDHFDQGKHIVMEQVHSHLTIIRDCWTQLAEREISNRMTYENLTKAKLYQLLKNLQDQKIFLQQNVSMIKGMSQSRSMLTVYFSAQKNPSADF